MSRELSFKSSHEAIRFMSLLTGSSVKIAKGDLIENVKEWLEDNSSKAKKFDLSKESGAISFVKYDKNKKVLDVNFSERGKYRYLGVPESVFLKMIESPSKGGFLNQRIKDQYAYKRVAQKQDRRTRIAKILSRSIFIGRLLSKKRPFNL